MDPKIIKTETEHKAFLAEVERLAAEDPMPGTAKGDRLELLAKLVEDYEQQRFPFARPDPVSAIKFRMEEKGLKQKDLADLMGGKNRVSDVFSGKRKLTLPMVQALSEGLGIPADLLIQESRPHAARAGGLVAAEPRASYGPRRRSVRRAAKRRVARRA